MINKVFVKQIGRNMEAYIDDIMVKIEKKKTEEHMKDLTEAFGVLKKFGVKLNPEKCIFGVVASKFLGFIVSHKGIEANLKKIKAIIDIKPPSLVKAG